MQAQCTPSFNISSLKKFVLVRSLNTFTLAFMFFYHKAACYEILCLTFF